MARSSIWDGSQWVSMTGGAGDGGGGGEPDDNYLRLDGANNNAPPSNYLRQSDGDARYLQLSGGTMGGAITMGGFKVQSLGTPTSSDDAATKGYIDSNFLALTGGTVTGATTFTVSLTAYSLVAQGNSLGTAIDSVDHPFTVNVPDGNDVRLWFTNKRYGTGGDHNTSQALIYRKVDSTYGGGIAFSTPGNVTVYTQWNTDGPYEGLATYLHLTSGEAQVKVGNFGFYTFRGDPRTEGNAPTVRNILIGTATPSNAWGSDGDIYIQHQV